MSQITAKFEYNEVTGVIRKWNPRSCDFDKAIYLRFLVKKYGDVGSLMAKEISSARLDKISQTDDVKEQEAIARDAITASALANPQIQADLTLYNQISEFADLAARVVSLTGTSFKWDKGSKSEKDIQGAFQNYIDDEDDMWTEIKRMVDLLDHPNGVSGTPKEGLTKEQVENPLSMSPDESGKS